VDDVYVIVNVIDQTDFNMPLEKRFKIAYYNAGTNVTVTSVTNIVSFGISAMTQIISLRSFCLYAMVGVTFCYFTVMTIFSCILVWDTQRVLKRKRECCGACWCAEDSLIFCRGKLLTRKQATLSGVIYG